MATNATLTHERAETPVPEGLSADAHPWRAAVLLGIAAVAAGLLWTIVLLPWVKHTDIWIMGGDVWTPLHAARYVSTGAYPYLYGADQNWLAGPALPIVLAPVSLIEDHFHLTSRSGFFGYNFYVAGHDYFNEEVHRPSVWPIYGAYGMALCIPMLFALRGFVRAAWERARLGDPGVLPSRAQIAVAAVGFPSALIYYGHYEDVLAFAFIMFAIALAWRNRWSRAGLMIGIAIAFKQWAVMPLILTIGLVPKERRGTYLLGALGLPALLYGIPLAVDWSHASFALFHGPAGPWNGHAAPWISQVDVSVGATPERAIWLALTVGLAIAVWKRRDPETLLASLVVVFAARLALEPVVYAYYLLGVVLFAVVLESVLGRSVLRAALAGGVSQAFFWVRAPLATEPRLAWWFLELALVALLALPAIQTLMRRSPVAATSPELATAAS
jgi:hypothetical protein